MYDVTRTTNELHSTRNALVVVALVYLVFLLNEIREDMNCKLRSKHDWFLACPSVTALSIVSGVMCVIIPCVEIDVSSVVVSIHTAQTTTDKAARSS
jgi:hypothetical protein